MKIFTKSEDNDIKNNYYTLFYTISLSVDKDNGDSLLQNVH